MAFNDEAQKEGRGIAYRLDVSLNNWSSIAYRWSTLAEVDGANAYDARIVSLGNLTRALSEDRIASAASFDLVLENTDGSLDWMASPASMNDVLKMRARLYIGLYDTADTYDGALPTITWKQLGEFLISENPSRDEGAISLTLTDNVFTLATQQVITPTFEDWYTISSGCPLRSVRPKDLAQMRAQPSWRQCFPLAWGEEVVPMVLPLPNIGGSMNSLSIGYGKVPLVLCVTADSSAGHVDSVSRLWLSMQSHEVGGINRNRAIEGMPVVPARQIVETEVFELPRKILDFTVWEPKKSAGFVLNGRTWYVVYALVDCEAFGFWRASLAEASRATVSYEESGGPEPYAMGFVTKAWGAGYPLSAVNNLATYAQHPVDIIKDITEYYSNGSSAYVDSARLNTVKLNTPGLQATFLVNNGKAGADIVPGLQQDISDLAASVDLDVLSTWDGKLAMTSLANDYHAQLADILEFDEGSIAEVRDGTPSREQRHAYFNRITLYGMRTGRDILGPAGEQLPNAGPYDNAVAPVTTATRVFQRALMARWTPRHQLARSPWEYRMVESVVRVRVSFKTDLRALAMDLGDFFLLTWTRNLTPAVYDRDIFQCEGLSLDLKEGTVEVQGVWIGDLEMNPPYLLDDENLLLRSTASRNITLTTGSAVANFTGGSLVAEGVVAGDILVVFDNLSSSHAFNRALRIVTVNSATQLTVTDANADYNWGTKSGVGNTGWYILRGATTYPTALTDPTNYPEGGDKYGKATNSSGVYSDGSEGSSLVG